MAPDAVLPTPNIALNSGARRKESASGCVENWAAALALAALVALHVVYAFVYRVDSDEPQHLHVVWGWVHGLLQYRDIFDNHCPLFQILCAPLLAALGEHSWIMAPMRLAMLPLYAADLSLVYLIGRALYVQRWAIWMAVVAGCVPAFFLVTTEFRTDDLWTTLWLAMLWQAVAGPLVGRRAFLFGLTTGACIAVSMKTALLLASLGTGGVFILALQVLSRHELKVSSMLKAAVLILAGIVIVPGVLIAYFAAHGALDRMYYCIIQHNAVPGLGKSGKIGFHLWLFPLSLPVLFGLGWLCMHSSAHARIGAGRALILIACGAYYFLLRSYWPLVTAQDFTPILPLAALTVLPFLFHLLSLTPWPARVAIPVTAMLLLAGETALVWRTQSPFLNMMTPFEQELSVVLRLTNPGDFVMDGKGESIFRKRPIYWVLEGVTLWRIHLGYIRENVRERIIATGTCVAFNHRLRPEDQTWLRNNFLEGGSKVWVAGKNLGPVRRQINFHTEIGAKYSIVSDGGKLAGTLDGAPLRDSQQIAPGDHRLLIASGAGDVALVWTQALERGFSPFSKVTAGVDDQNL